MSKKIILFYEFINGIIEVTKYLIISCFDGVHDTVADVILKDDLADVVDCGAYRGNLDQYLAAVASVLDHGPDGFHMPDGTVHAV